MEHLTNVQLKQKAIQKAYEAFGIDWETIKNNIDENGKTTYDVYLKMSIKQQKKCELVGGLWHMILPKSLIGLNHNNGWTRIEPDGSNLPISKGYCKIGDLRGTEWVEGGEYDAEDVKKLFKSGFCTHYHPVVELLKPIY